MGPVWVRCPVPRHSQWPGRCCALIGQAWVTCPPWRHGIAPTLTIWTESGGGVTSPEEMLDVVTRRENDDQQAKITDVH